MLNNCVLNKQTLPAEKLLCAVCSRKPGASGHKHKQVTQVSFSLRLTSSWVVPRHLPLGLLPYHMGGNPLSALHIFRAAAGIRELMAQPQAGGQFSQPCLLSRTPIPHPRQQP